MAKLIINSLIFKDDIVHFDKIFNECFKSLVEIGKSINNLINRNLLSVKKINMLDVEIINATTNLNEASEEKKIFTNEELLHNFSNFSEQNEKKTNIDNSLIKNLKLDSILSKANDLSISESFLLNENNRSIQLNEDSYKKDKSKDSNKVKSPRI